MFNFDPNRIINLICLLLQLYSGIKKKNDAGSEYIRHAMMLAHLALQRDHSRRDRRYRQHIRNNRLPRSIWNKRGKTDDWWVKLRDGEKPAEDWVINLRMTKQQFYKLLEQISPHIATGANCPNYRALPPCKKLAMTIYYLADTGSLVRTANTFGVDRSTASKIVRFVCLQIYQHLSPRYIKLPKTEKEMQESIVRFSRKRNMPQAFGAIDGTHVKIIAPREDSTAYFNYKQFYSLNVQAVCDGVGIFMNVDCRWPGAAHDARVFKHSRVNLELASGEIPQTLATLFPESPKLRNYIIGDPAYPLLPHVMKEVHRVTTPEEASFNECLRLARNPIECAFGRLKARWRILGQTMLLGLESLPSVIITCFVLHNFIELEPNYHITPDLVAEMEANRIEQSAYVNHPDPVFSYNSKEGEAASKTLLEFIAHSDPTTN